MEVYVLVVLPSREPGFLENVGDIFVFDHSPRSYFFDRMLDACILFRFFSMGGIGSLMLMVFIWGGLDSGGFLVEEDCVVEFGEQLS